MKGMFNPVLMNSPRGAAAPDFEAEVETLLSGTAGWAVDLADTATVFTDTAGTIPVSTPGVDTISRVNSKFGTTTYNWQQGTAAAEPLWNGASQQADGVDDLVQTTGWTCLNGATGVTFTLRFLVDTLSGERMLFSCSTLTGTVGRFQLRVNSDGSISLFTRRTDAEAQQSFTTATGLVTTATSYTVQCSVNYLTGAVVIYLDGASVATGTHTGTDGVNGVDATNSGRCRWGLNTSNTLNDYFDGKLGAAVMQLAVATAEQRASAKGFVERNAL